VRDIAIVALACHELDAAHGARLIEVVKKSMIEGATRVVIDFPQDVVINFAGVRALETSSRTLGGAQHLCISGLGPRMRALLETVELTDDVALFEWWGDAVDRFAASH
jgi:anti-anti-sigma regulatory factor